MGLNMAVPPHQSGIMPSTVVAVVRIIGLKRCRHASTTASGGCLPYSSISILIRSINTIALFIIIPDSAIKPSKVKNPKDEFATSKPIVTPIKPSGIVVRIISGRRTELNWATNNNMINMAATGNLAAIEALASPDYSASPPSSK